MSIAFSLKYLYATGVYFEVVYSDPRQKQKAEHKEYSQRGPAVWACDLRSPTEPYTQEDPVLGSMLCRHQLKIPNNF